MSDWPDVKRKIESPSLVAATDNNEVLEKLRRLAFEVYSHLEFGRALRPLREVCAASILMHWKQFQQDHPGNVVLKTFESCATLVGLDPDQLPYLGDRIKRSFELRNAAHRSVSGEDLKAEFDQLSQCKPNVLRPLFPLLIWIVSHVVLSYSFIAVSELTSTLQQRM